MSLSILKNADIWTHSLLDSKWHLLKCYSLALASKEKSDTGKLFYTSKDQFSLLLKPVCILCFMVACNLYLMTDFSSLKQNCRSLQVLLQTSAQILEFAFDKLEQSQTTEFVTLLYPTFESCFTIVM